MILFAPFVSVYVTVVIPTLKLRLPTKLIPVDAELPVVAPLITQVSLLTLQLPLVIGLGLLMFALHLFPLMDEEILAGQVMDAGVLSATVTVNEHVAFCDPLLAVYVIVVVPTLKFLVPTRFIPPEADEPVVAPDITHVRVLELEYAGSGTVTLAVQPLEADALTLAGQLTVGVAQSLTVTA
jgi:hypothetical protein